ncbi:MAG: hypothetical protein PHD15_04670 [Clostridia bacterium]|nr:hypothetical protein [Clostridia bacterium]MDD4387033.1 hypothetical protein [Clostridia bacterium]
MKKDIIEKIVSKLSEYGIECELGGITDIKIDKEFLDAKWSTGEKKIEFHALVYFSEEESTIYYYETTKDIGSGFSFGSDSETSFQSGTTLFRKVKSVGYGIDGKAFEYTIDLGAVPKTFKDIAKENSWKFKTVIMKKKALYPNQKQENIVTKDVINTTDSEVKNKTEETTKNVDKTNKIRPIIFWIWAVFTSLIILLFISASGTTISFILSTIVMIALIVKRKKIYEKIFKFIMTMIFVPIILILLIILMSPAGASNFTTTTDISVVKDGVDISRAVFASEIDDVTYKPLTETKTFKPTDEVSYVLECVYIPVGTTINYVWTYGDETLINENYTLTEEISNRYLNISFTKNDGLESVPTGKYKVTVYGTKDGVENFKFASECNVIE